MVRFLFIRFSSIGDIVLTTPVVRCLKKQVEGVEIHYVTKRQFRGILEPNPYIDEVITLENSMSHLVSLLKKNSYDYIIDLHHNLRSAIIKRRLKRMDFTFEKMNLQKWLLVNFKINRLPEMHIVDRYLETLKLFDVKNDFQGLDYFIKEKDVVPPELLPQTHQNGYIGWVIGAKHNTKKYPVKHVIEVLKQLQKPVLLLGGTEDMSDAEEITAHTGGYVYNACGKYNLSQSASLVKQAKIIVSNDTGLMHIAAAFKKPVLSIWGNTIPAFGMYPYFPGEGSFQFEAEGLSCRPCSKIGFSECPKKHFHCMEKQNQSLIIEKIRKLIQDN